MVPNLGLNDRWSSKLALPKPELCKFVRSYCMNGLNIPFVYFSLPETKEKTLEEVIYILLCTFNAQNVSS